MNYDTSEKHLRFFEAECRRLQKRWLLTTWSLEVKHGTRDDSKIEASLDTDEEGRVLTVTLATYLSKKPTQAYLKELARHEMVHAVTQPMGVTGERRYVTEGVRVAAAHEVLERLDRLLP